MTAGGFHRAVQQRAWPRITLCGWIRTPRTTSSSAAMAACRSRADRGDTHGFPVEHADRPIYEVDVDQASPFRICGGLQDNGVWCSAERGEKPERNRRPRSVETSAAATASTRMFDPANPSMVLQSSQNGNVAWVNIETLERQALRSGTGSECPADAAGGRTWRSRRRGRPRLAKAKAGRRPRAGGRGGYRWNWDTPFIVSHHDPKTWFMGAQMLFKSTDRGRAGRRSAAISR